MWKRREGFEQMAAHSQQLVSYARQGQVATITLNRPDKRNAFNADLVRSLRQALADFDSDQEARVAILCGAGKAFSPRPQPMSRSESHRVSKAAR